MAILNNPHHAFQQLLTPFEVWLGSEKEGERLCGRVSDPSAEIIGPFVVQCEATHATDVNVTLVQVGFARLSSHPCRLVTIASCNLIVLMPIPFMPTLY